MLDNLSLLLLLHRLSHLAVGRKPAEVVVGDNYRGVSSDIESEMKEIEDWGTNDMDMDILFCVDRI